MHLSKILHHIGSFHNEIVDNCLLSKLYNFHVTDKIKESIIAVLTGFFCTPPNSRIISFSLIE